jgi:hypothetical protein
MPNTIRFDTNVPIEIALQNDAGITVSGRYGDRVMYTLDDGRTMYLAPFVAGRIGELGIRAGEPFTICKRYVGTGRRKSVDWLVERLKADDETQLERDLRKSIEIASARDENPPSPPQPPSASARPLTFCPKPLMKASDLPARLPTEGNGFRHRHQSSPPSPTDNGNPPPPNTQLVHALKTAIAAAVEAEKFAKTLDYNIRFTTDDVRSMGITLLIGMQQRQR